MPKGDPVERRERAQQHVVAPAELARALEGEQVIGLLHDAQRTLISPRIAADAAGIFFRDVEAHVAMDDELLELGERLREGPHFVEGALEQEEGQPLGGLGPDSGKPLQCFDEPGYRLGVIGQEVATFPCRGS